MTASNKIKPVLINLNIGDQLTATSCSHVVVELIKFISHQRLQIPYTYQWLKQVVNKKKMNENSAKRKACSLRCIIVPFPVLWKTWT